MTSNETNNIDYDQSAETDKLGFQVKNNGSMDMLIDSRRSPSPTVEGLSIYNVRSTLRRNLILFAVSLVAFLPAFCDTMYLPALDMIVVELNTSTTLVAASVSIFLFMVGICCLIWGPASDRFGRRVTIIIALVIFLVVTIPCIFAPNIATLIVFRALEGGSVSASLAVGPSIIADTFPEEKRGMASGIFYLPLNVGPIIGPLIGGPLAEQFSWRSTFVFLAIFSLIVTIIVVFLIPETHHYFVKTRFEKEYPRNYIVDAKSVEIVPFKQFCKSLPHLIDSTTIPYILVMSTTFAAIYSGFLMYTISLSGPPYNLTTAEIGILYAPSGVSLFIGSIFGGWVSDRASAYFGYEKCPEGRLVPAMALSTFLLIGSLIFGWGFQYKLNMAVPIVGLVILCFGQSVVEPGISAYLTIIKFEHAATISALNSFFNFVITGIIVTVTNPLCKAMGIGFFFTLVCGINLVVIGISSVLIFIKIKRANYVAI